MAKNDFLSWDTTASNNTDIGGIGILGSNAVKNFDDAFRTLMAQLRTGVDGEVVYAAKSANYTAVANDNNAWHRYTATATVSLTAAATLAANWHYFVQADGATITIDPNASETINGATTLVLQSGQTAAIICTGTAFLAIVGGTPISGPAQQGYIYGLTLSNNVSDATNDIDISAGAAAADTSPYYLMQLASTLTKRLDAAWAVGTGNGGLDTGSVGNNTYYVWLIQRSDTGVVDALFSLSGTAPTMPTNYDRKRVIGSFARVSASNTAPRSYSQKEDTAWVAYTPTFNGVGTATNIKCRSRRSGSCLDVEVVFTAGTVTATTFDMSLGFNGTNANVVCDTFWNTFRPLAGFSIWTQAIASSLYIIGLGGSGVVNLSSQSAGRDGFTPVPGTFLVTGTTFGFRFSIPIEGWNT